MNGGINLFMAFQNYNTKENNAALLQVTGNKPPERKKMYYAFKQVTSLQPENCYRVDRIISGMDSVRVLTMRKKGDGFVYVHLTNLSPSVVDVKVEVNGYQIKECHKYVTDGEHDEALMEDNEVSLSNGKMEVKIGGHAVTTLKITIEPKL